MGFSLVHIMNSFSNTAKGTDSFFDFLSDYVLKTNLDHLKILNDENELQSFGLIYTILGEFILWLFQYESTNSGYFFALSFLLNKNNLRAESYATAKNNCIKNSLIASQLFLLSILGISGIGIFSMLVPCKSEDKKHYPDLLLYLCGGVFALKYSLGISAAIFNSMAQYITPLSTVAYDGFERLGLVHYPVFQISKPKPQLQI